MLPDVPLLVIGGLPPLLEDCAICEVVRAPPRLRSSLLIEFSCATFCVGVAGSFNSWRSFSRRAMRSGGAGWLEVQEVFFAVSTFASVLKKLTMSAGV